MTPGKLWNMTDQTLRDAKFALRMLVKNPVFALTAILPLALAMGANTAIFSVLDAVTLKKLPIPQPSRLVEMHLLDSRYGRGALSYAQIQNLNSLKSTFQSVSGWMLPTLNAQIDDRLFRVVALVVTPEYYSTFPVPAVLGRTLLPSDSQSTGRTSVAVISEQFWRTHFGHSPNVIGQVIRIEGSVFSIVGVVPASFTSPQTDLSADVALPIEASPLSIFEGLSHFDRKSAYLLSTFGRLQQGVSLPQARAQLAVLWPSILADSQPATLNPEQAARFLSRRLQLEPGARGESFLRDQYSDSLYFLMVAVALLLLIACANIAALLLARAVSRSGEFSVRLALGASRNQIFRQLFTESFMLATLSTFIGALSAIWLSRTLLNLMWNYAFPLTLSLRPDLKVLLYSMLVTCCATILFGVAPGWFVAHRELNTGIRGGGKSVIGSAPRSAKRYLVSVEIALCLVLLASALSLIKTTNKLRTVNLGFKPDKVVELYLVPNPGSHQTADKDEYQRTLLTHVSSMPGVNAAALSEWLPVNNGTWNEQIRADFSGREKSAPVLAHAQVISHGFFATLGTTLLQGRDFSIRDTATSQKVVIVSKSLAERLYSPGAAVGHTILVGSDGESDERLQIIGISEDTRFGDLNAYNRLQIYLPLFQQPKRLPYAIMEIRARGNPVSIVPNVSLEIRKLGREYVWRAEALSQTIDLNISQERILVSIATFFGIVAMCLACIGVYGLLAFMVHERIRELGLRVALGATTHGILRLVLGEAILLLCIGVTGGLPLSFLATKLLQSRLPYLAFGDAISFIQTVIAVILCGLIAASVPAIRASKINPTEALRVE